MNSLVGQQLLTVSEFPPKLCTANYFQTAIREGNYMSAVTACPSCDNTVSPRAFDCPGCGHPLRKPKRGFFGKIFKWLLILFNVLMVVWLFSYLGEVGAVMDGSGSEAERAGAAIGGTIGMGMILTYWVIGDIILGLATILTRPSK